MGITGFELLKVVVKRGFPTAMLTVPFRMETPTPIAVGETYISPMSFWQALL